MLVFNKGEEEKFKTWLYYYHYEEAEELREQGVDIVISLGDYAQCEACCILEDPQCFLSWYNDWVEEEC